MSPGAANTKQHERAPRARLALGGLLLASIGPSLSQTLVIPAIPEIERQFGSSPEAATLALTGFLLSFSVTTPLSGRLGDLFGAARVMVAVILIFAVGSVVCALADSIETLVAGRVLQGVSGGVFPLAYAIVRQVCEPGRVPFAIGAVSATFGVGGALGLALSGPITETLGVAWLFWVGLAIVPAAVMVMLAVSSHPRQATAGRVDWAGAGLLAAFLITTLLGISKAGESGWEPAGLLLALGLGIGALFVAVEARRKFPLVDLGLLRYRPVVMSNLCGLAIGFTMFAAFLAIPKLAQAPDQIAAPVGEAGLLLAPGALAMILAGPGAGMVASRWGAGRPLAIGMLVAATSTFSLAVVPAGKAALVVAVIGIGIGIGFVVASMANVVVEAVAPEVIGIATGINTITRTIGGAIGAQVATAILAGNTDPSSGLPAGSAYSVAFAVAGSIAVLGFAAALAVPRTSVVH